MGKRSEVGGCQPIHVTGWDRFWIDDGVLYSSFWSGEAAYLISMGPAKAVEGMALTQRALTSAKVLPFNRR